MNLIRDEEKNDRIDQKPEEKQYLWIIYPFYIKVKLVHFATISVMT